jgi:N-acetylated-alpha-linked acidic dipeptidase
VYAFFGREEDYAELTKAGIDVKGKIVLARYGAIFRGNIVTRLHFINKGFE